MASRFNKLLLISFFRTCTYVVQRSIENNRSGNMFEEKKTQYVSSAQVVERGAGARIIREVICGRN